MQDKDCAISCTSYVQMIVDGLKEGRLFKAREKVDYHRVLLDCPVGHSTVMMCPSWAYRSSLTSENAQTMHSGLKNLKQKPYIWGLPETLVKYRVRGKSLSSNKFTLVKYHWKPYREIEQMNVLSSVFHIAYWGFIKVFGIK